MSALTPLPPLPQAGEGWGERLCARLTSIFEQQDFTRATWGIISGMVDGHFPPTGDHNQLRLYCRCGAGYLRLPLEDEA